MEKPVSCLPMVPALYDRQGGTRLDRVLLPRRLSDNLQGNGMNTLKTPDEQGKDRDRMEEISRTIVTVFNEQGPEAAYKLLQEAHAIIARWKK
jgi:hypothetical protein